MVSKFECKQCGQCCTQPAGGSTSASKFPAFIGQGPFFVLNRPGTIFYEWELPAIRKAAKKLKVKLAPVPMMMVYDLKSGRSVVLSYTLREAACPFHAKEKGCSIYKDRPLTCQAFPAPAGMSWFLNGRMSLAPKCCQHELIPAALEKEFTQSGKPFMFMRNLIERYGNTHIAQCCAELLFRAENDFLMAKEKEGRLRLERATAPADRVAMLAAKSRKITLSDLYAEMGFSMERAAMVKNCTDAGQVGAAIRKVAGLE